MAMLSSDVVQQITRQSAGELAVGIRAGDYSCVEVVEAHIQRIEQTHAALNAVVFPLFDQARREAEQADDALRRDGPLGPLHGVPVTIKEMFDVAGTPMTLGLDHRRGLLADEDAALVERLRRAGAIVLGKTNVPQLGLSIETANPLYGRTNNPWQLERSPGGSSGGEAAIVAAGGSPLGLASDGAGSIRQPAHACGVCGFKPTSGRLTLRGHWHYLTFPAGFAQPGPIARRVADLELALRVLASDQPDLRDAEVAPVALRAPSAVSLGDLRIGVCTGDGYLPPSPAIRRAVEEAAAALGALGAEVQPFTPPDVIRAWEIFFGLMYADGGYYARQELDGSRRARHTRENLLLTTAPSVLRPLIAMLLKALGQTYLAHAFQFTPRRSVSAARYLELLDRCADYRAELLAVLDKRGLDAIVCPPSALPAPPHNSGYASYSVLYTMIYNLAGLPAGVVPATRVRDGEESDRQAGRDRVLGDLQRVEHGSAGLPAGVQVVARPWREDVALAVMAALEQHFRAQPDYPQRPPL